MGDLITYQGQSLVMASEPPLAGPAARFYDIRFIPMSTDCWRGYVANWKVEDDKLWLVSIEGRAEVTDMEAWRRERLELRKRLRQGEISPTENGHLLRDARKRLTTVRKIDLNFLYGTTEPVHAEWFSGLIRIPRGEMLSYVHMDYFSVFESDLLLFFHQGILRETREIDNTSPGEPDNFPYFP